MISRLIFILLFSSFASYSFSQEPEYTQSGYTSLSIHLSGKVPAGLPEIAMLHVSNPFVQDKPAKFNVVNDSTMMLSFYTFGPTTVYFQLDKQMKTSVLLPNQQDELHLHYTGGQDYTLDYRGHFKELFDGSDMFYDAVREYFSSDYFMTYQPASYKTAVEFRDDILQRIANLKEGLGKNISSPLIRRLFEIGMENNNKNYHLFDYYESTFWTYTADKSEERTNQKVEIPERGLAYYTGIITAQYADTTSLLAANFNLLHNIRQSLAPELLPIWEIGFEAYLNRLEALFGSVFPQSENLFYDLMLAGAYIDQINQDQPLSVGQRYEVATHFKNKHLSNYILYQDDLSMSKRNFGSAVSGTHYFPFDQNNKEVLGHILAKYKGKVVVMDFWATWCGPCLEAHELIKPVKAHYVDRDDVVFVYLTNETSDYLRWKDYVSVLGGEHYYLYNGQHSAICDRYGITSIPSYLIFDKKGELSSSSLGGYMGSEKAKEWIEKALVGK